MAKPKKTLKAYALKRPGDEETAPGVILSTIRSSAVKARQVWHRAYAGESLDVVELEIREVAGK